MKRTIHDSETNSNLDPLKGVTIQKTDLVKVTVSGEYYLALQRIAGILNKELPLSQGDNPDTPQTLLNNFILTNDVDNEFECIVEGMDYTAHIKGGVDSKEAETQESEIKNHLIDVWRKATVE